MNYFRINLNKLEDPARKRREELRLLARFGALNLCLLVLLVTALVWTIQMSGKLTEFEKLKADLKVQIRKLEANKNYISEQDVRSLKKLDNQRIFWTQKLEALAALSGSNIVLTSLRLQGGNLYLEGVARVKKNENNFNVVSGFIERIKELEYFTRDFKRIEFKSSTRIDFMDQPVLTFEITCYPK